MSTKELENAAKYQKYIATAFENAHIKEKLPTPQKVDVSEYNPAQVLALNNLQTVTDTNTASSIIGSLNENEINYLNKYFTSFKNSLPNKTITSIGDFTTRFNTFYIEDIGKQTQPVTSELVKKTIVLKKKYNVDELTYMDKRQLDDLFRFVYKEKMGREPQVGDKIEYITTEGKTSMPIPIIDISDYVVFSLRGTVKNSENPKMRYIFQNSGDKSFASIRSLNPKWKWIGMSDSGSASGSGLSEISKEIPFLKSKLLKKKLVHFR